MKTIKKRWVVVPAFAFFIAMAVTGCSSVATLEELKSLEDTRADILLLEQQQMLLQQKLSMLTASINARNLQLNEIAQKKEALMKYQ